MKIERDPESSRFLKIRRVILQKLLIRMKESRTGTSTTPVALNTLAGSREEKRSKRRVILKSDRRTAFVKVR